MKRLCLIALLMSAAASGIAGDCGCRSAARIIDGINVPTSSFPSVGQVGDSRGGFYCTGTLIAPRFVLSAAHCVVSGKTGALAVGQTEGRFLLGGVTYKTAHIYVNPTYMGDSSQEKEGAIDLSILELDQDVPGVPILQLYRKTPVVGTILTLVGFGEQGTGTTGVDGTFPAAGTVNMGRTPIDVVTATFIKWNFDRKDPSQAESNTAPGDSGGPQFITENGDLFVASVTSGGNKSNAGFGDFSYNTRVDVGAAWIDSITGGTIAPGNHPPAIDSLGVNPVSPNPGDAVTFSASATDPDGDTLRYHWFFGDGTEDINGTANETHTYVVDGTYALQLVVTDGRGGSASIDMSVKVGSGITTIPILASQISQQKFLLNFVNATRDTFAFTLTHPDLIFTSAQAYNNLVNGTTVKVYVGQTQIDGLSYIAGRAVGLGTLKSNFRAGSLQYSVRNNSKLTAVLLPFGAVNADVSMNLTVPVRIQVGNSRYGGDAMYLYTARLNRTGIGK